MIFGKITSKRVQWMLTAGAVAGVLLGAHLTNQQNQAQANALMQQMLEGTWELTSLKGEPIGILGNHAILSQRMTLREGRVQGVTLLRMGTDAAMTSMPFPDASVRRVTASSDGMRVIVYWDGAYALTERRFLDLTIGKAKYRASLKFDARKPLLEMEHDTILTYPGAAVYQPANSLIAERLDPAP